MAQQRARLLRTKIAGSPAIDAQKQALIVRNTAGRSPLKVCILSSHPVGLGAFSRVLLPPAFRVLTRYLDSIFPPDLRRLALPWAPVYVIDAYASQAATAALLANVAERSPSAKLLIVSKKFTTVQSHALLRLGAKGFLTYSEAREQLPRAVPLVAAGGVWMPRALLWAFVDSVRESIRGRRLRMEGPRVSSGEQEVLDALLENLSDKEIGSRLHISERTVKFRVSKLLSKFGVRRRGDLILCYYKEQKSPRGL